MIFKRSKISDVVICDPVVFRDGRGYFMESFRKDKLEEFLGFGLKFCQDNESMSTYGVLRGLHYQLPPRSQTKLVRVIEGSLLDVVVDIRQGSPTFGEHIAIILSGDNKRQLFIPRGFAHGFVVLSQTAIFSYKCDNYYSPEYERGLTFYDPQLNIDWKIPRNEMVVSDRDLRHPLFQDIELFDYDQSPYC